MFERTNIYGTKPQKPGLDEKRYPSALIPPSANISDGTVAKIVVKKQIPTILWGFFCLIKNPPE